MNCQRLAWSPCFARKPCGLPQGGMAFLASQGSAKTPRGLPRGASLCFARLAWVVALIGASAAAGVVELREKYAESPTRAWFPEGPVGKCLAVSGGQIEYPVLFSRTNAVEGTFACWFKVTRSGIYNNESPAAVGGVGAVWLTTTDGLSFNFTCPGYSRAVSNAFFKSFHHLVFTWDRDGEQTWLDGQRVYEKKYAKKTGQPTPGRDAGNSKFISYGSLSGCWVDEAIVLDRRLSEAEAVALSQRKEVWTVDSNTVFYAGFEGTLNAQGYVKSGGDVVRLITEIGRVDATFRAGDEPAFVFQVLNGTSEKKVLSVQGVVRDLEKNPAMKRTIPIQARPGTLTKVRFDLNEVKRNGLFWGDFALVGDGKIIQSERIPFAKTMAVDPRRCSGDELRSGFTLAEGLNQSTYQKWGLIEYTDWAMLEPEEGEWYLDQLDLRVNSLVAGGSIPIIMFNDPPAWYKKRFKNTGMCGYYYPDTDDPQAMALWKTYVRKLGERYKGKVCDYEVYGEAYGRSDPRHYGRLVAITADELHAVDPKIRVACNFAGYHDWARGVAKEAAGHADIYTFHPYPWVGGAGSIHLTDEKILAPYANFLKQALRQSSGQAGAAVKWANTEYACYQLMGAAIWPDGYPMTADEFDRNVKWDKLSSAYINRGRHSFVDQITGAFRVVRGHTMNMAVDCHYALWWSSQGGGISDLKFAAHTPSPESAAYANITGFLAGYRFARRLDLGADYLYGYLFRKGDEYRLVAFTDAGEAVVFPELAGKKLKVLDQHANDLDVENTGGAVRLHLKPLAPVYVMGISQAASTNRPVLKVASVEPVVYPGAPAGLRVSVFNPLDCAIDGILTMKFPESFATVPDRQVHVGPGEVVTQIVSVPVPTAVIAKQTYAVRLNTGAPELGIIAYSFILPVRQSTVAKPTPRPLSIDGDLAKWGNPDAFQIAINNPEQVIRGIPYTKLYMMDQKVDWKGANDLAARAAVMYDADNLYIAVRVWDDVIKNVWRAEPVYIYQGDSVELFIDGRGGDEQGALTFVGDVYHIKLAPSMDPKLPPFHHVSKPKRGMDIPGFSYASKILPDGYTFEIKFPRSAVPGFKFEKGAKMGFALQIGDQDQTSMFGSRETGAAKTTMLWGGEIGVAGDPSQFGTIIFGGP